MYQLIDYLQDEKLLPRVAAQAQKSISFKNMIEIYDKLPLFEPEILQCIQTTFHESNRDVEFEMLQKIY